jgi:hypothetical protein
VAFSWTHACGCEGHLSGNKFAENTFFACNSSRFALASLPMSERDVSERPVDSVAPGSIYGNDSSWTVAIGKTERRSDRLAPGQRASCSGQCSRLVRRLRSWRNGAQGCRKAPGYTAPVPYGAAVRQPFPKPWQQTLFGTRLLTARGLTAADTSIFCLGTTRGGMGSTRRRGSRSDRTTGEIPP